MNIPKSLHTLTVFVNVARAVAPELISAGRPYAAIQRAADVLGYPHGTPDDYQIMLKASAVLMREASA